VVVESISVSGEPLPTDEELPIGSKISGKKNTFISLDRECAGGGVMLILSENCQVMGYCTMIIGK
jgi:hypothetical protein